MRDRTNRFVSRCILTFILLSCALAAFWSTNETDKSEIIASHVGRFLASDKGHHKSEEPLEEILEHESILDENDFSQLDLTVVTSIVLILILLTVAFEKGKEALEETVSADLKIILEKLFGELTVLGFLAIVTFSATQTGFITYLSVQIYDEKEELLEFFEYVHFSIFAIMIAFVIQVIVLVNEATITEEKWHDMDTKCRELHLTPDNQLMPTESEHQAAIQLRKMYWLTRIFKGCRDVKQVDQKEFYVFQALRNEFILDRGLESPFEAKSGQNRVNSEEFNFGRYLSLAQAHMLTHIVEVKGHTWICFGVGAVAWYGIAMAVHRQVETLAWIWLSIGWMVLFSNLLFEEHLYDLRRVFIPKKLLSMLYADSTGVELNEESQRSFRETTALLQQNPEYFPAWCDVNLETYQRRGRTLLTKLLVGGVPNRQQACFWFDRKGPSFYRTALQINLIFVGVYSGLLLLVFLPYLCRQHPLWLFSIYLVLAIIPPYVVTVNKRDIVATLTQVTSIGTYRKVQIISDVLREEKTYQVVRAFIIINRMRRHAAHSLEHGERPRRSLTRATSSFSRLELAEVSKTFETLDLDNSGSITSSELGELLTKLGAKTSDDEIARILSSLDHNQDGEVTKDEFLAWYADSIDSEELDPMKRARDLFEMFDTNDSEEITIGEFKEKLDSLNMGFTVDEIGAIVNELDRDRSGTVSLEEFELLLEKYHPKELKLRREIGPSH